MGRDNGQDSVIPDGLVDGYAKHIKKNSNIGIICPQVIDKRRIYSVAEKDNGEVYVDFCITSAACTSVEAWENAENRRMAIYRSCR